LWNLSCEFADLFGSVPEPLRPYLPSFQHALIDLAPMDDRSLSAEARLRAFLKALKYGRRADFADCIDIVLTEALALDRKDLFVILTYLDKGPMAQNHAVLHEALERLVPEQKDSIVGWFTRNY
jgi:hypothetical protein